MNPLSKISTHYQAILQLIANNPVSLIVAPTGTGKSLGIPWILAKNKTKVFISEPTITAAISVSNYLKTLDPTLKIGYAAEGNIHYDDSSEIVYATSGHLRRKMLSYFNNGHCNQLDFTAVLIIDEYHLKKADNDIIMGLWNHCYEQGKTVPRLVLASATPIKTSTTIPKNIPTEIIPPDPNVPFTDVPEEIVSEPDSKDKGGPETKLSIFQNIPFYDIPQKGFPINIVYHNRNYDLSDNELYSDIVKLITDLHQSTVKGHILVFMAGAGEVETLIHNLRLKNAVILPAYSRLSSDQLNKIYDPVPEGFRKIVVATNVVETAITIEDVSIVIDSLIEKRAETSLSGGLRLVTTYISKSSAKQRCGRAGRTIAGTCYRMSTQKFYEALADEFPSELLRVPIYEYVMEILNAGLDPLDVIPEIGTNKLADSVKLLVQLKMIDPNNNNRPTEIGTFATRMPMDVRSSVVLWKWLKQDLPPFVGIVMTALVSNGGNYFYTPKPNEGEDRADYSIRIDNLREEFWHKFMGRSDIETLANIWNDLMEYIGGPYPSGEFNYFEVKNWTNENSFNFKTLREVLHIITQIINIVKSMHYSVLLGPFSADGMIDKYRELVRDVYQDRIMKLQTIRKRLIYVPILNTYGNRDDQYFLDSKSINELSINPAREIIALIVREIVTSSRNIKLISTSLDLDDRVTVINPKSYILSTGLYDEDPEQSVAEEPVVNPDTQLSQEQADRLKAALEIIKSG